MDDPREDRREIAKHLLDSNEDPRGLDVFCGEARGICRAFKRGIYQSGEQPDRGQSNQGCKPFLAQQIGHASYSASLAGSFLIHVTPRNLADIIRGTAYSFTIRNPTVR